MKKKNVLFVFADQWRRSAVGYEGQEPVITPNMDAFAADSIVCTNGVSTCPLCSPARASLLTGKHPLATGVFTNCKTGASIRLKDEEICISDVLQKEGYQTGYIGKWHLDEPEVNHVKNPPSGARNWDAYTPAGPRRHGFDFWYAYNASDEHTTPHYWKDDDRMIKQDVWSPIHETDVALQFLKTRKQDAPFALFLSWNPPHSPYDTAPEQYKKLYENLQLPRKKNVQLGAVHHHTFESFDLDEEAFIALQKDYYAAITGLDEQFGRLIEYLKQNNILSDTLVVLTADHGDMLGSHQLIGKHVWYEESIGVPLLFGGMDLPSGKTETVIGSPDIAPTILDLLNLPIPPTMEGISCASSIEKGMTDETKACFLAACPGREVFLRQFEAASLDPKAFGWRSVRTKDACYVVEVGYTTTPCLRRYFYDLQADPEQINPLLLSEPHPLEGALIKWLRDANDPFITHVEGTK